MHTVSDEIFLYKRGKLGLLGPTIDEESSRFTPDVLLGLMGSISQIGAYDVIQHKSESLLPGSLVLGLALVQ